MSPRSRAGRRARALRGVSLVEALAALAVMSVGMVGIVGLQATLRNNTDLSRQRAEAVRIAQQHIERLRSFDRVLSSTQGLAFDDLSGGNNLGYTAPATSNTSYMLNATMSPTALPGDGSVPRYRQVNVNVTWTDKAGTGQSVAIATTVARISPELGGSVGLAANRGATQLPRQRNLAIPVTAVNNGDGTSTFTPPGSTSLTWVFNNQSGLITSICQPAGTCTATTSALLSGYVWFALNLDPSVTANHASEQPNSDSLAAKLGVTLTDPVSPAAATCFSQTFTKYVGYYCAVPLNSSGNWSGKSALVDGQGITLAASATDSIATRHRVCRYTASATTDTPLLPGTTVVDNAAHPLNYSAVAVSLPNQNFLVISAGDGSAAYTCPTDDTSTPYINGTTRLHQPLS